MCIGIPMRVVAVDADGTTWCTRDGRDRSAVDIALVGPQPPGTWLLIFLGSAREVLTEDYAHTVAQALKGVAAALAGADFDQYFSDLIGREPQLPPHLLPALSNSQEDSGR